MYLSLYCNVCVWEGVGDRTKTAIYWPPLLWSSVLCLSCSPVLLNRRPNSLLDDGFLYHILSPTGLQTPSGVVAFLTTSLQIVWSPTPDFLSPPSYIIVQSPTQSLEWHVWSSSSGNKRHTVQRSLFSGTSVDECIMGFYLVPFHQPNPPTRFLSITGHWNVSLPSGASLCNGRFGRVEGQYTTISMKHILINGNSLNNHFVHIQKEICKPSQGRCPVV